MTEETLAVIKKLLQNHRGKVLGSLFGMILAIAILCFGFWSVLFVVILGVLGLFVGSQIDRGDDVLAQLENGVRNVWQLLKQKR